MVQTIFMHLFKKIIFCCCFIIANHPLHAQTALSDAVLKPMRGKPAPFSSFTQKDSLILVCFWSVNSDESVNELNAINPHVQDWKDAVKFKLMAVSVEEGKLADRVRPTAIMNGWTFEVFVDINGDLRKALNSTNLPQSFIIKNGKIVYRQSGFESGTENYLFQKVIEFSKQK